MTPRGLQDHINDWEPWNWAEAQHQARNLACLTGRAYIVPVQRGELAYDGEDQHGFASDGYKVTTRRPKSAGYTVVKL